MKNHVKFLLLFTLLIPRTSYAQDVNIKIGHRDSVQSKILNENRKLVISLPNGYDSTDQNYPVLYLLDGTENNLIDARLVTYNLWTDMIIIAIPNTDRDRDMMPLSAPSYEVKNPEADKFLSFIEEELIPYIDNNYRSSKERTIRGQSLSGLFVMYAFLAKPELFSNYIGNCAGWFADMDSFFNTLADQAFLNEDRFNGKKLFVANSLADPLDPKQEIHQAMLNFSIKLKSIFGDSIKFKYATYENAGHVPYASFYDGLRYVLGNAKGENQFTLNGYSSQSKVQLAGSFNDWIPMEMTFRDNIWQTEVELITGDVCLYKFIVDGKWIHDRENPLTQYDGHGGLNSVIIID